MSREASADVGGRGQQVGEELGPGHVYMPFVVMEVGDRCGLIRTHISPICRSPVAPKNI